MPRFAEGTTVSVEKTQAEIQSLVRKYGASDFISGWSIGCAKIGFSIKGRHVRFVLPLPDQGDNRFTRTERYGHVRSKDSEYAAWEQECRQLWRALHLTIKAKLEAVECKISLFDEEFLAHIVMPNGLTIGEHLLPQMECIVTTGRMQPLLTGPKQ